MPIFIDVFIAPLRDNPAAQIALTGALVTLAIDWLLGTVCAFARHDYSSTVARHGIAHKASELCFIMLGIIVDGMLAGGLNIGPAAPVFCSSCVYIAVMEIASIFETVGAANPALAKSPIFAPVLRLLKSMQDHMEDEPEVSESPAHMSVE